MKKPPQNVLELPLIERAELALKAAVEKVMEEHAREGFYRLCFARRRDNRNIR